MIEARTQDLNRFSPAWDRKFQQARNPQTTSAETLADWLRPARG